MKFQAARDLGRIGEELAEWWFQTKGWGSIPVYDYSGLANDKAPKLMFETRGVVVPDLDIMQNGRRKWCEVKTYHHAHRNDRHKCLVHGIEKRLFDHYLDVQEESGCEVLLAVLEVSTGDLLVRSLNRLVTRLPCQCGCDLNPRNCRTRIKAGVYFPRREFDVVHTFTNESRFVELRAKWPTPPSARPPQGSLFSATP